MLNCAHSLDMYYSFQFACRTRHTDARPVISCLGSYAGYSSYSDAVSLRAWASSGHGLVYLVSQLQLASATHIVHPRHCHYTCHNWGIASLKETSQSNWPELGLEQGDVTASVRCLARDQTSSLFLATQSSAASTYTHAVQWAAQTIQHSGG